MQNQKFLSKSPILIDDFERNWKKTFDILVYIWKKHVKYAQTSREYNIQHY